MSRVGYGVVGIARAVVVLAALSMSACGSPDEQAQSYYQQGMSLLARADPARASVQLKNALRLKSDFVPALRALAQIDETAQDWPAVGAILRRLAALEPNDIDVRLRLARLSLFEGTFHEALEWASAAIAIDQNHAGARALRALILFKTGEEDTAVHEARDALQMDRANVDAVMVLAAARLAHDDADGALKILDTIPPIPQDELGIELLKINAFEKLGNTDEVLPRLRRLVELNPRESSLKAQLLQFYLAHGDQQESEQLLRNEVVASPGNTKAVLDLVQFLNLTKGQPASRQELLAHVRAGGDVFPYQMALAELELAGGNIHPGIEEVSALAQGLKETDRILATRYLLARMYVAARNFASAETTIADILNTDPRNTNAFQLRATVRLEQGRPDDAIADLRQALSDRPRSPELISLLAVAYERIGSVELAERGFADATKASDFAPAFGLDYVAFLQRHGGVSQAEDVLVELFRHRPADVSVLSTLAQVRLARQNWAGAREVAGAIRQLDNQQALADQILAAVLDGEKKYTDSIALLQEANATNPGVAPLMSSLVRSYVLAGQIEKAGAYLDLVLGKDPGNAEALVLKGLAQLGRNAPEEATRSYKAAIETQPKNARGYRALAELYSNRKQYDEALGVLQAGLRELPTDFSLRLAQAGIMEIRGNIDQAIEQYELLLKDDPESLIVANNLASLLSDYRSDKESRERAEVLARGLVKSPIPQFKDTLGWISHLRGDTRAAISLLEEAVMQLPDSPLIRYHLAICYVDVGEAEMAKAELRKAAALLPPDGGALVDRIRAALGG